MSVKQNRPIETIHLSLRDRRKVIEQINSTSRSVPAQLERRGLRVEFNVGQIIVNITHPNRHVAAYNVVPRNLARRGVAFIHGQFLYVNSACEALLPMLNGKWATVSGRVVACRHLAGLMHEVCVAFHAPIGLREFVQLTPEQSRRIEREIALGRGGSAEATEPMPSDKVRSALAVIEDRSTRQLVMLWLEQLGFEVRAAASGQEAAQIMQSSGSDLVVVDLMIDQDKGERIIRKLKSAGYRGLIIAISADGRDIVNRQAMEAGAGACLEMPSTLASLQQTIERLTDAAARDQAAADAPAPDQSPPLFTTLSHDPGLRPLIEEFVGTLGQTARELSDAVRHADLPRAQRLCRQLKGVGGSLGFEPITAAARLAALSMEKEDADLKLVQARVAELVDLLQRARVA